MAMAAAPQSDSCCCLTNGTLSTRIQPGSAVAVVGEAGRAVPRYVEHAPTVTSAMARRSERRGTAALDEDDDDDDEQEDEDERDLGDAPPFEVLQRLGVLLTLGVALELG